jgi:hypothetical protein
MRVFLVYFVMLEEALPSATASSVLMLLLAFVDDYGIIPKMLTSHGGLSHAFSDGKRGWPRMHGHIF